MGERGGGNQISNFSQNQKSPKYHMELVGLDIFWDFFISWLPLFGIYYHIKLTQQELV